MTKKTASIIIRTYNEEKYLNELLDMISKQDQSIYNIETIIVDSGSFDRTIEIASKYLCNIVFIDKKDFSFGRSLNLGCDNANGDFLVFISGHCIPTNEYWINNLISPLEESCHYSYGKQIGRDTTKFSERQLFNKYFPNKSELPQQGFFCNNANAAIRTNIWKDYLFDNEITGCEDMHLAKRIVEDGYFIGYSSDAEVYHIHDESWDNVLVRYERESIALQQIMPEIQLSSFDICKFILVGILKDIKEAFKQKVLFKELYSIIRFRFCQYIGAYRGNHNNRKISKSMKEKYFYPRITKK